MRKKKFVLKVPEMSGARIRELAERIKPVMEFKEEGRCYIKPVDIFAESFTWDPEPATKALGLKSICDITTYHPYGYIGNFKPSVAQVILQIPREHLDKVIAFEIVKVPDEFPDNSSPEYEALDAGYHTARTRLYSRE
jgi:hypothetical protein